MAANDPYVVTANWLNLRSGPDANAPALAVLAEGDVVIVQDDHLPDWWRISIADGAVASGYVASHYLAPQPSQSAAPAAPAVADNPSFIVLTLTGDDQLPSVERAIQAIVNDPRQQGTTLFGLGNQRYGLTRAAMKAMLARQEANATRDILVSALGGLPGVTKAELATGTAVRAAYAARPAETPISVAATNAAAVDSQGIAWNVALVRAPEAWDMAGGLAARPWSSIRVGHIDTGFTRHPVLGFGGGSPESPFDLIHEGINYREPGALPLDPLDYAGQPGHGTRTSSVLCGFEQGTLIGVAPGVSVVPYRITDCVVIDTIATHTCFADAINHAANDAGCAVLSVSLGDPCFPPEAVGIQVDAAYEHGVILVAAAGNYTSEVTYPGRYSRAITAGGITADLIPWTGSSRGARVDICAPAENVFRANMRLVNGVAQPETLDTGGDGTSYATVHVAGAAALWLTYRAAELGPLHGSWQLVETFRWCLRKSARVPSPTWDSQSWGAGILDIVALLNCALPNPAELRPANLAAKEWN
jgi:hypothetical protein